VRGEAADELLEDDLQQFRDLRMDAETFAVALVAQRGLVARGRHRLPIPG
jgi:hypothetical protein